MDMDYVLLTGTIIVMNALYMLAMYLIYRRGIAIHLAAIILGVADLLGATGFVLGKEGITLAGLGISIVITVPPTTVLLVMMAKQIIAPAKLMAATAEQIVETDLMRLTSAIGAIANGDLTQSVTFQTQEVTYKSGNELGDLARAFNQMIARLQEAGQSFGEMAAGLRQVIGDIDQVSQRLAEGDLRAMPEAEYRGDFMQIKDGLEAALSGLNSTISQTNVVVEQVVPSVEQIRAISQNLAASAEEQSSAAEEVSSSLEETDAQVRTNAESANVANQLVSQTSDVANTGQEKMKFMIKAMAAIATSSQQISKIIKVIDEIAFQTNLLALNAAVEAARAGQHGRGFAVVAQEVRNLAGRSAKAARETAELIEDAGRRVEEGVGIADETATALGEIVHNVAKVKDLVAEIAAASEDQAKGVAQVNSAMVQVSQGAQTASQQSEELASTGDELGQLAEMLRNETARFKLREQQGRAPALAGVTPEMLQRVAEMVRAQGVTVGGAPTAATPQAVKEEGAKLDLPLDRDERGYGEF